MIIVTINAGSSSVRLGAYSRGEEGVRGLAKVKHELTKAEPEALLRGFLDTVEGDAAAVAHRVVHGGTAFSGPCLLDAEVERAIERVAPLAPLHNPAALRWIEAAREVLGVQCPQVAVFDTGFYAALPEPARSYALPQPLAEKHGLRRFGFHGIAHQAMSDQIRERVPAYAGDGGLISLQLGGGCSITASRGGRPQDTSMGFSPTEGLVMATRSGDIDPGVLTFLQRREGWGAERIEQLLNHESGLLGVSGISGDMRDLLASEQPQARLAVAMFCYRARKYIGAYAAALGRVDAISFGGGIGENAPRVRAEILAGLDLLGVELDADANAHALGAAARISTAGSRVAVWVTPVDEGAAMTARAGEVLR